MTILMEMASRQTRATATTTIVPSIPVRPILATASTRTAMELADELFDQDNDNFTTCNGDCRDNDNTSNPGATEVIDGLDNDCDGIADNHTDQYDDDGDGYSEDQGDCNDQAQNAGGVADWSRCHRSGAQRRRRARADRQRL